jgi:hypothetical protein
MVNAERWCGQYNLVDFGKNNDMHDYTMLHEVLLGWMVLDSPGLVNRIKISSYSASPSVTANAGVGGCRCCLSNGRWSQ